MQKTDNRLMEDLTKHDCRNCEKECLTIDVWPPDNNDAYTKTTGVWVSPVEGRSFVLCDTCADDLYTKGKLGYSGGGDAFLV